MTRPDRYDYIGMVLALFMVALWVAHFALPPLPPDPSRNSPPGAVPSGPPR
jgi:hypothetical protein